MPQLSGEHRQGVVQLAVPMLHAKMHMRTKLAFFCFVLYPQQQIAIAMHMAVIKGSHRACHKMKRSFLR